MMSNWTTYILNPDNSRNVLIHNIGRALILQIETCVGFIFWQNQLSQQGQMVEKSFRTRWAVLCLSYRHYCQGGGFFHFLRGWLTSEGWFGWRPTGKKGKNGKKSGRGANCTALPMHLKAEQQWKVWPTHQLSGGEGGFGEAEKLFIKQPQLQK